MPDAAPIGMQVLIVTHRPDGIGRVEAMRLPRVDGVEYLVSWQSHDNAPIPSSLSQREDIHIFRFGEAGVSANRNNLLRLATAPLVLIGDDDLIYTADSIRAAKRCMEEHPNVDYFSFRYSGPDTKVYPDAECSLRPIPKNFFQTAFEVGLNLRGKAHSLCFSPMFGPGARRFTAAEDEMLLRTALHQGLECRFFPITVAEHPTLTTGLRDTVSPGFMRSKGALIALSNPLTWPLHIPLEAWREYRKDRMKLFPALRHTASGALYAAINRTSLFNSGKYEA